MNLSLKPNDYYNPAYIGNKFRKKRFEFFESKACVLPRPVKILDIGGEVNFWKQVNYYGNDDFDITVLNLRAKQARFSNITVVEGNACALTDFRDKEFDISFSNSVIEHLYNRDNQIKMAGEAIRVGTYYFIQTPNLYFPIEPHFKFPFFQFLPDKIKILLQTRTSLINGVKYGRNYAEQVIKEIVLLSKKDLCAIFPDAYIYEEKFFGLTKSFIAHNFPDN
jgi:ubiquinone/menaquinone biosynthesis C-methylase UbiE